MNNEEVRYGYPPSRDLSTCVSRLSSLQMGAARSDDHPSVLEVEPACAKAGGPEDKGSLAVEGSLGRAGGWGVGKTSKMWEPQIH